MMVNRIKRFGLTIIEKQSELSEMAMALRLNANPNYKHEIQNRTYTYLTENEARSIGSEFIRFLGEALVEDDPSTAFEKVTQWGHRAGQLSIKENIPLEATLEGTRFFRQAIFQLAQEVYQNIEFTVDDILTISSIIDPLIDQCIYAFSFEFIESQRKTIEGAKQSIKALSAPIIPIADDVGILPIVGEIDSQRSKIIMDKTLKRCVELEIHYLMIDLSGVTTMDTLVAQSLYQVVKSLKLIGVHTIITGIRPEVAQTMVTLDIHFRDTPTLGTLQQALQSLGIGR